MNEFSTETTRPYVGRTRVNVLFIEDDAMNRRVVKDMLDVAGAAMVGAEDAEQGLALVEQQDFDVALVEILLLDRSEEHTSELQSLMRISYAVFCLKKKTLNQSSFQHTNQN